MTGAVSNRLAEQSRLLFAENRYFSVLRLEITA
jgi:hypothetical protein